MSSRVTVRCGWVPLHYLVTSENDFRLSEAVIISSWVIELILWPSNKKLFNFIYQFQLLHYIMQTDILRLSNEN